MTDSVSPTAAANGTAADLQRIIHILRAYCEGPSQQPRPEGPPAHSEIASDSESPANRLAAVFGLTPFERDILLLCAGVELDAEIAAIVAGLQNGGTPTFALALAALPDAHWSALLPNAPLRYWRLIDIDRGQPPARSPLRIDERILHVFVGLHCLDTDLAPLVQVVPPPAELVPSQRAVAERVAATWADGGEGPSAFRTVQLSGPDAAARSAVAATACALADQTLLALNSEDLPTDSESSERLQRLWEREALLVGAVPMIVCDRPEGEDRARDRALDGIFERARSPLIVSSAVRRTAAMLPMINFEIAKPTPDEQLEAWRHALGDESEIDEADLRALVYQFDLRLSAIRAASADALAGKAVGPGDAEGAIAPTPAQTLWDSCRRQARSPLDGVLHRIEPCGGWDDLVLPERERATLRAIVDQVKHRATVHGDWGFSQKGERGLGVAALFAGSSGTGKTLAAEVLAAELKLDLYRIDLSAVVNKYIGETEKNLGRVFAAAEAGGAILLFDEADALFGKRSDVKDSHDRYANIEISYLLQRIETYRGLAILTTNLKESIDQAFLRRLRFVVQFPFPDAALRAQMWRRMFPEQTPVGDLDFARLAQLNISGGGIRNIALNAAFAAAAHGGVVSMSNVRNAATSEYSKLEKTLTAAETKGWS